MVFFSVFFFAVSLLAVFRAPAKPLWYAAIAATEWGHWLALIGFLLVALRWRSQRSWDVSSMLLLAAVCLYMTPLLRAHRVAQDLPAQLSVHMGVSSPRQRQRALARSKPLDYAELFSGISSPGVQVTNRTYATTDGLALTLDLYRPLIFDQALPGVLVVHSGSWQGGDRKEFTALNRYLAARGYVVAAMDYRMAPRSIFPAQRNDVYAALAYLKSHAKEIGLDQDHLVLLGRSAGGQIALSAAYERKDPAIRGVIAMYAPNDLAWGYTIPSNLLIMNSQDVIHTYLGGSPAQVPQVYEAASPLHFVSKNTPPTLMIHGVRDELVWVQHDERLSKRLAEEGRPYFYLRLPWATHGCDANFSGPCGQLSTYTIERFLVEVMPSGAEERLAQSKSRKGHHV